MKMFNTEVSPLELEQLLRRISTVIERSDFILGKEVEELELKLQEFTRAKHCITCASGTDAIVIALMAAGIGRGDSVIVPSFTFAATAEAVAFLGATPVFADIDTCTFTLSTVEVEKTLKKCKASAIIGVDIFGMPCDWKELNRIARENNILTIADAAQSFGASIGKEKVGTLADITCTSFFPTKPLACIGDGGAIFTNQSYVADTAKSIRSHGTSGKKYHHSRIGMNSRLDTIQAAILLEKLQRINGERACRKFIHSLYRDVLSNFNTMYQLEPAGYDSAASVFSFISRDRDKTKSNLDLLDIQNQIYYPTPIHEQEAYKSFFDRTISGNISKTSFICNSIISVPAHAGMKEKEVNMVMNGLKAAMEAQSR